MGIPPRYPDDFKRDAVRLITEEQYKFKAAAQAVGVREKSLRDLHKKIAPPLKTCGDDASVDELREEGEKGTFYFAGEKVDCPLAYFLSARNSAFR